MFRNLFRSERSSLVAATMLHIMTLNTVKEHLIWVKNYLHLKSAENIHYMIIIATQTWHARALSAGPLCTTSCIYLIRTTEVSHQCKNQRFSSGPEGHMCRKREKEVY